MTRTSGPKLVHPIDTPKPRDRFIVGPNRGGNFPAIGPNITECRTLDSDEWLTNLLWNSGTGGEHQAPSIFTFNCSFCGSMSRSKDNGSSVPGNCVTETNDKTFRQAQIDFEVWKCCVSCV